MAVYAGIGSRDCPQDIQILIIKTAYWLANKGYVLRSGGAEGCDLAFEYGCDKGKGLKEIYLPWSGFNGSTSNLVVKNERAFEIAKKYHPYYNNLKDGAKKLQARNSHQVLGLELESPCDFVLCYTKDGKGLGGTGQALRIAKDYNIPIFDFGCYSSLEESREKFRDFVATNIDK